MAVPWGTNHLLTNTAGSGGDEELAAADQSFESSGSSGSGGQAGMEVHSASDNGVEEIVATEQVIEPSVEDMSGTLLNLNQNENQIAGAGMDRQEVGLILIFSSMKKPRMQDNQK